MNSRKHRNPLLPFVVLVLLSTVSRTQDQGLTFHWSGKLSADKVVEIRNANGNIDAETIAGDEIQVTAEKSGRNADQVKIEVVTDGDGVTICAIYPPGIFGGSAGRCEPNKSYSSNVHGDNAQVHFIVPQESPFLRRDGQRQRVRRGYGPLRPCHKRQWFDPHINRGLGSGRHGERLHKSHHGRCGLEWHTQVCQREWLGRVANAGRSQR